MAKTREDAIEIGERLLKSMPFHNPSRVAICEMVEYLESLRERRANITKMVSVAEVSSLTEKLEEVTKQRDAYKAYIDSLERSLLPNDSIDEHS